MLVVAWWHGGMVAWWFDWLRLELGALCEQQAFVVRVFAEHQAWHAQFATDAELGSSVCIAIAAPLLEQPAASGRIERTN